MNNEEKQRLDNKIASQDPEDRLQINMINQAVRLYEAADLLIRMYEKRVMKQGFGFRNEIKRTFNLMRQDINHLKYHVENFSDLYYKAYEDQAIEAMDAIQDSGFIYAQIALLMGDRCATQEIVDGIIEKIKSYPAGDMVNDEIIEFIKPK